MSTNLSERSNCIIRVALMNLSSVLPDLSSEGDEVSLARGRDEIRVALDEMGTPNRREQVIFDKYWKMWGLE